MHARALAELYSVPLEEFVAARNDLATRLKAEGDGETAAEVAKLRKPSFPVWLIDRLARAEPELMKHLLKAGADLRDATSAGDAVKLRTATADRKAAVTRLVAGAEREAKAAGRAVTADQRDRVVRTLLLGAVDEDARDALSTGTLTEELEPSGLEGFAGPELTVVSSGPDPDHEKDKRRAEELAQRASELELEAARLEDQADSLEESARVARRTAQAARRRAERAREKADDALERLT